MSDLDCLCINIPINYIDEYNYVRFGVTLGNREYPCI